MESWSPYRDSEVWKQEPDGMVSDLPEDNLGGESQEALDQINGMPSKGDVAENGEPKTFIAAQEQFSDLHFLKRLKRDKHPLLKPVRPTQISLALYGLGDVSKWGFGI